jgi:hypothetical protein
MHFYTSDEERKYKSLSDYEHGDCLKYIFEHVCGQFTNEFLQKQIYRGRAKIGAFALGEIVFGKLIHEWLRATYPTEFIS